MDRKKSRRFRRLFAAFFESDHRSLFYPVEYPPSSLPIYPAGAVLLITDGECIEKRTLPGCRGHIGNAPDPDVAILAMLMPLLCLRRRRYRNEQDGHCNHQKHNEAERLHGHLPLCHALLSLTAIIMR